MYQSIIYNGLLSSRRACQTSSRVNLHRLFASSASTPFISTDPASSPSSTDGPVISVIINAIDGFQSATNLPWWATLVTVGATVRTAMLPFTLKGIQASAALFPLLKQARDEEKEKENGKKGDVGTSTNINGSSDAAQGSVVRIAQRFHQLRTQHGAPHPFWIIGSPLIQLPVFITSMASIRSMSLQNWPGLSTGGTAWFSDLTQAAMDLTTMTTPMGVYGSILPFAIVLSMYANIDAGFRGLTSQTNKNESGVTVWVFGKVRLVLEWFLVPLLITALQLPQATLCYWITSSTYALVQNHVLKLPSVRSRLIEGLNSTLPTQSPINSSSSNKGTNKINNNNKVVLPIEMNEEMNAMFGRAAQLRAQGDFHGAASVLRSMLDRYPEHPRAFFALGQVLSGIKEWKDASHAYVQAARLESEPQQACRAWFGAGVALHMSGREDDAIEAFTRSAVKEAGEQLQVRSWVAAATLQEKLGRREEAVALLRRAAKVEPKVNDIYLKPLLRGENT